MGFYADLKPLKYYIYRKADREEKRIGRSYLLEILGWKLVGVEDFD